MSDITPHNEDSISPPLETPAAIDVDAPARASGSHRLTSLFEVVVCSGYPTQLLVGGALAGLGLASMDGAGGLSLNWVVLLSLTDAALLVGIIVYFLRRSGEAPRTVFLGARALGPELTLGVPIMVLSLAVAMASLGTLRFFLPDLRNVPENPLQGLLESPLNAAIFAAVAILAGAVREELQRAFILHRFDQHLGGGWLGLGIFSVAFGLGHLLQGWDAAIVTGLLGVLWGATYLRRRSVVSAMVAHAGFNVTEILIALAGLSAEGG